MTPRDGVGRHDDLNAGHPGKLGQGRPQISRRDGKDLLTVRQSTLFRQGRCPNRNRGKCRRKAEDGQSNFIATHDLSPQAIHAALGTEDGMRLPNRTQEIAKLFIVLCFFFMTRPTSLVPRDQLQAAIVFYD
ncbi:hypothetical protein GLI01_15910 [Gluconacetobacter liquefaciens]|nr:hypothetical protein GLI01_15910 [Gluconacetobacter liquefaciens]